MKFEKIVELIKEYEEKNAAVQDIEATIKSCKSNLKRFADTGNKYIDVHFAYDKWESVYPRYLYPSETVREAVIADLQKHISELTAHRDKHLARLLDIKNILEKSEVDYVSVDGITHSINPED